jgi:hypothetical protein
MTVAVVVCGSAATAWADDLNPPPWERGGPGTTWQAWTFPTAASPTAPDEGFLNPNGTPMITITDGNWLPIEDNHVGVWQITQPNSSIVANIPDYPYTPYGKTVWTQVTWSGEGGVPDVSVSTTWKGNTNTFTGNLICRTLLTNYPPNGNNQPWYQDVVETIIPYNPCQEDVTITGKIDCGEVVVDTVCPEPSTIVLLGIGAVSLLAYAWRKRRQTV